MKDTLATIIGIVVVLILAAYLFFGSGLSAKTKSLTDTTVDKLDTVTNSINGL